MSIPKVSVLVPIYKTERAFLREAVRSVLNQTFGDFELVLLEDCPDDPREAVVLEFGDPRIRYEKNERNLGITPSRNRLIDLARGEYLAIFDHDDICHPDRLAKEVAWLDAHPECGVVSSWTRRIPVDKLSKWPDGNLKLALLDGCVIAHTAAMIRKSVLTEHGIRYDERFSPAEDWGLWLQLIPYTEFHNIQEPLVDYRWFAGNTSHRQAEKMQLGAARARAWAQTHLPDLYVEYQAQAKTIRRVRLLGLPVMKFVTCFSTTKGYLFDILPILSIKSKMSL